MAVLVKMLGCGQDTTFYTVLCVLLMMSTLSFRFALPGKWPFRCIGSNTTSLCRVVRFATCLTAWINILWLPFSSVAIFVVVVVIIVIIVWVRVFGVTVFVSRINLSIFSFFSLFFQQATQVPVRSWFFTVVARWFGSVSICVCSIVAHSIYL